MNENDIQGPVILWLDYGAVEGWHPKSFSTIKEALEADRYDNKFVVTKLVKYTVVDDTDAKTSS